MFDVSVDFYAAHMLTIFFLLDFIIHASFGLRLLRLSSGLLYFILIVFHLNLLVFDYLFIYLFYFFPFSYVCSMFFFSFKLSSHLHTHYQSPPLNPHRTQSHSPSRWCLKGLFLMQNLGWNLKLLRENLWCGVEDR